MAGFYACHFSVGWNCDGVVYLLSAATLPSPPPNEGSYSLLVLYTESTQTLKLRVLQPVPKAAIHNECGLLVCF